MKQDLSYWNSGFRDTVTYIESFGCACGVRQCKAKSLYFFQHFYSTLQPNDATALRSANLGTIPWHCSLPDNQVPIQQHLEKKNRRVTILLETR